MEIKPLDIVNIHEAKTHLSHLVAQALVEPLTLLTHDAALARYGSAVRVV